MNKIIKAKYTELSDSVPSEILILPFGKIETTEGSYIVDKESADSILSYFNKMGHDMVIDYEHQTLKDIQAPAAGWIKKLIVKDDGIYGEVEWTDKAKDYIENKEYRYLSPVLYVDDDGRVVYLQCVALTNLPATFSAKPIVNKHGEGFMNEVFEVLGVKSETEAVQKIKALKEQKPKEVLPDDILKELNLKKDASVSEAKAAILALKQSKTAFDSLSDELKALKEQLAEKEIGELVEMALKEGKILPAQKEWATEYARRDIEGFKVFVSKSPRVVEFKGSSNQDKKKDDIDDLQLSVNRMLGVDEELFKKYKAKI